MSKTYEIIKKQRKPNPQALEKLKEYNRFRRSITAALKENGPMTVPQLAEKIGQPADKTLYYLMTMHKYGLVVVDSIDDMDEYYLYKLAEKKK